MIKTWSKVTMVMGAGMGLFPLLHVWEMYSVKSSAGQSFIGVLRELARRSAKGLAA